jgi:hypothetical protein
MNRRLGIGLAIGLGAALLTIAFLLGRDSRSASTPSVLVVVATPAPGVSSPPGARSPAASALAEKTLSPPNADAASPAPALAPESPSAMPAFAPTHPTAAASAPRGDEATRAAVSRYFSEMEALQAGAKSWSGDPNAAAQEILKQTLEGTSGGLDGLIDSNRDLLTRLRALEVPAPCATHHQNTIQVVEQSQGLLTRMRDAMASQNQSALLELASEGRSVERRAKEVDALAAEIKKRYGL